MEIDGMGCNHVKRWLSGQSEGALFSPGGGSCAHWKCATLEPSDGPPPGITQSMQHMWTVL